MLDQQQIDQEVNVILLRRIIELLDTKESQEPLKADEIRAALRNELSLVVKSIKAIPDNSDVLKELKVLTKAIGAIELSPSINVEAATVTVPDVVVPDIKVPQANITVTVPDVIVPPINVPQAIINVESPTVNVEPTDLSSIIKELDRQLNKIRTNSVGRPLAVRLTDGQEWIKKLEVLSESARQIASFSSVGEVYLKNADGSRFNPATADGQNGATGIGNGSKNVTTAGTRVQLSETNTPCRSVIITALITNTDTIWVGGATVAAGSGTPLVALQSEKFDINNINKIYIDAVVSGEGVSYTYLT